MKPMLLWLAVQLIALAIGAGGLPLSMQHQAPAEVWSVQTMLVTQVCAAALFWPALFGDWRASIAVILVSIPFAQAAGFLSASSRGPLIASSALAIVWLITLAVLPLRRSHTTSATITRMLVALWPIGGAILSYLHAEFGNDDRSFSLGPAVRIVTCLRGHVEPQAWIEATIVLCIAIIARIATFKKQTSN